MTDSQLTTLSVCVVCHTCGKTRSATLEKAARRTAPAVWAGCVCGTSPLKEEGEAVQPTVNKRTGNWPTNRAAGAGTDTLSV